MQKMPKARRAASTILRLRFIHTAIPRIQPENGWSKSLPQIHRMVTSRQWLEILSRADNARAYSSTFLTTASTVLTAIWKCRQKTIGFWRKQKRRYRDLARPRTLLNYRQLPRRTYEYGRGSFFWSGEVCRRNHGTGRIMLSWQPVRIERSEPQSQVL